MTKEQQQFKYPGTRVALDGNSAVIACERESSDAAGAYPITPSTQMGEYWAEAVASGHINISQRPLLFIEPEGEHAAAAVTAGFAMTGLRATNFSSGQGIAYMHESLYAAVGKRLTYVLNMGTRAMTKATLNVHAGHDDYHCVDDTGFFQVFAKNAQAAADLNIIAHRLAELALNPGIVAQDGFLTTHLIESLQLPERDLIAEYLGRPDDIINTPTPAQRLLYGPTRRRIPELWDVDNPVMAGVVQNQDSYMQSVAAQRPFFFAHIAELAEQAFTEFYQLTGRRYQRLQSYCAEDAEYLLLGQGSVVPSAEVVADHLRATRQIKVGVVNLTMFRPFPADLLSHTLKGKKGVAVLERVDQPLAADLPLMREIRATLSKCIENGLMTDNAPYPQLAVYQARDIPRLYSACFGLGSRDLQPEGLIAAVENMLPGAKQRTHYYLGIDFIHELARTPKQQLQQETLLDAYPRLRDLALHGSENPDLMPAGSIAVRMHSVGGWGAITTGKNLAHTLFDLFGLDIKANPLYGAEKKGQPTTYFLAAAPEPVRLNGELRYVDVVLSPDPNVLQHTNALAGLKAGGVFVLQSDADSSAKAWATFPAAYQKIIVEKHYRVFYLDAFKIAREEATDPELQLRMQGNAFQGAFFAATQLAAQRGFDEAKLIDAITEQLQKKFGSKGARVVQDNVRVVKRGYDEVHEITEKPLTGNTVGVPVTTEPRLPTALKHWPQSKSAIADTQRFWEQTGTFYARGQGNDNLADPFIALGTLPAASAVFRDMSGVRFHHPQWIADKCTGCGNCYTVCPDTAIPGLVSEFGAVLNTAVTRLQAQAKNVPHLPHWVRIVEKQWRALCQQAKETDSTRALLDLALQQTLAQASDSERPACESELALLRAELGDFQFALTRPYFTLPEKKAPGSGGLFLINVNPNTCKGCGECIAVCHDDALREEPQTPTSLARLRREWDFWLDLPNTPKHFQRVQDLDQRIGTLHTILLDKNVYGTMTGGDGACLGCSEKTVIHLFTATVQALMQPRVEKHIAHLTELILQLERHIQLKLTSEINIDDTATILTALNQVTTADVNLSQLAGNLEKIRGNEPVDRKWLRRAMQLVEKLKDLKWRYVEGGSGRGRSNMGMVNSTGCTSVWGSSYPFNPYPFPWANHLFQDSPSMAMGVFEGHMAKMADGFKAIRMAELELRGEYSAAEHDAYFAYFDWRQFTDEEFNLAPPVVVVGGDGAMYDIGFQNLSRMMMSGRPIKVVVVDTQVYSNTGGQACTSGFFGQVSDMAPFGEAHHGKEEVRKEIGLIGMAHRTTYVMQSTIAHPNHMIEGFIEGLLTRRPALFNCYATCQPEHGVADDQGYQQAKLAVESRAYPLFRYNPDKGKTPQQCFDLSGNPEHNNDWPSYTLKYHEGETEKQLSLPLTFADFAMTEGRFRKHFRTAPPDTWHDKMLPLAEFLLLDADARTDKYPFIWTVDRQKQLGRLLVDTSMVAACEDRRDFWQMLRAIAGVGPTVTDVAAMEAKVRNEVVTRLSASLADLTRSANSGKAPLPVSSAAAAAARERPNTAPTSDDYLAPWLDTEQCTACGECMAVNPNIFAYNARQKAYIKNPDGGPYRDLVKAAEKCTAQIIHPGLPRERDKDTEVWIKRAQQFNE